MKRKLCIKNTLTWLAVIFFCSVTCGAIMGCIYELATMGGVFQ